MCSLYYIFVIMVGFSSMQIVLLILFASWRNTWVNLVHPLDLAVIFRLIQNEFRVLCVTSNFMSPMGRWCDSFSFISLLILELAFFTNWCFKYSVLKDFSSLLSCSSRYSSSDSASSSEVAALTLKFCYTSALISILSFLLASLVLSDFSFF